MTTFDIHRHGRHYEPEYPPQGNSDHLPMAWLALGGLGATDELRAAFAAAYLPRLQAFAPDAPARRRIAELTAWIRRDGMAAVLSALLPRYISG